MQQQSQIFVFSTALANKGAEAVRNGQFPTIIAYHCAQPETKKFLQVLFVFSFKTKYHCLHLLLIFIILEISTKS
jgi:hypothetical protein